MCGSERYKAPSGVEGFGITPHSLLVGLEASGASVAAELSIKVACDSLDTCKRMCQHRHACVTRGKGYVGTPSHCNATGPYLAVSQSSSSGQRVCMQRSASPEGEKAITAERSRRSVQSAKWSSDAAPASRLQPLEPRSQSAWWHGARGEGGGT